MKCYLQVGKIINTHGLRGEVKVMPLTDDPRRFEELESLIHVLTDTVEDSVVKTSKNLTIDGVKYFKDKVILKFKEINSIDEATLIKNTFLVVSRENAVKLPEGRYFICDLIGCEVTDVERGLLGNLVEVIKTASNDIYVVKNQNKKEFLIPVLKTVIKEVDIENKKIQVQMPEGL